MSFLSTVWLRLAYSRHPWLFPLYPLGWLFRAIVTLRRQLYLNGYIVRHKFACPVIVVGNITIGGTGKTPVVMWLVSYLERHGYKPGVVSNGYGGSSHAGPRQVIQHDSPALVGDEALMMVHKISAPVVVSRDRAKGIAMLRNELGANIVIMDDGMQHYRVERDFEIALIDAERGLGNRQCLPAGPLREPPSRLKTVDWLVSQGSDLHAQHHFTLEISNCVSLNNEHQSKPLSAFKGTVHAVAGIGNPGRFFNSLRSKGLNIIEHPFPDHHPFSASDFESFSDELIIMTDKDAIKCHSFKLKNAWRLSVVPHGLDALGYEILSRLQKDVPHGSKTS